MMDNLIPLLIRRDPEDPECADVFVAVALAGGVREFVLDTGAGRTMLDLDAESAALPSLGVRSSGGVFERTEDDRVRLPRLRLGPIAHEELEVVRSRRTGVRNLLGMDVLGRHRLGFDFAEGRCAVDPPVPWMGIGAENELETGSAGHPYVRVDFGEAQASAVWDTGAGVTVVDAGYVDAHASLFLAEGVSTGTDSTGAKMETPRYRMAGYTIGGLNFRSHRVVAVDLATLNRHASRRTDMILGWPTLSQARWLLDFPARRWGLRGVA